MTSASTAAGLLLGYAADRVFGDPHRGHPVAGFGFLAGGLEVRLWRDDRRAGIAHVAVLVGGPTLVTAATAAGLRGLPGRRLRDPAHTLLTAALTWAALGGRSLETEARAMGDLLAAGKLPAARERLSHLCSREATDLDADELARATIESVAENTADAVTGPLFWGALAGPAGIVGYRCANTLDAMVGYRNARYRRFGWAAARTDDWLNILPARLTGALTVLAAPLVGGRSADAWQAWRRDAAAHPSPNAGVVEAAAAGALGVQLGGVNRYGQDVEDRGRLGHGPAAGLADLPRAVTLSRLVGLGAAVACAGLAGALAAARHAGSERISPSARGLGVVRTAPAPVHGAAARGGTPAAALGEGR